MKPLPSQGSDKHHILSSSLHSLRRSPFFLFFAFYVSTIGAHKAIYQQTELTVVLFILSVLCRKDCKSRVCVCVFSGTNTLFISKTVGKHSNPMLATRRKQSITALPSSNTAWKNQPSSMKKSLQQSPLRRKICHPNIPSSWRRRRWCDSVQNGETRAGCLRKREQSIRVETKRENWVFWLIGFERGQRAWSSLTGKS